MTRIQIYHILILYSLIYTCYSQYPCSYPNTDLIWDYTDMSQTNGTSTGFYQGQVSDFAIKIALYDEWSFGTRTFQFPLTVAMWVKKTAGSGIQGLFDSSKVVNQIAQNNNRFYVFMSGGKLGVEFMSSSGNSCMWVWDSVFSTNTWVHFSISITDGDNIQAYKNGNAITQIQDCSGNGYTLSNISRNQNRLAMNYLGKERFIGYLEDFVLIENIVTAAQAFCLYAGQQYTCRFPCSQCEGGAANCIQCVSAVGGNNRVVPSPYGSCECLDGYFETGANQCPICDAVCSTCETTSDNCTSCVNTNMYTPYCQCIDGEYEFMPFDGEEGDQYCKFCQHQCLTCTDGTACTSCPIGVFRDISQTTTCPCLNGYYDDGQNQLCLKCDYECSTCETQNYNCLTCANGVGRDLVAPDCGCQDGYYDDDQLNCKACYYWCSTCINESTNCLSCRGTNRQNDPPSCDCIVGYYYNGNTQGNCYQCNPWCYSCTNSPSNCLVCQGQNRDNNNAPACPCLDGYYHTGARDCQPCPYYCKTCSNATTCTSCHENGTRTNTGNCGCAEGHYDVGVLTCEICHESCRYCSGPDFDQCTACYGVRNVIGGECLCYYRYYEDYKGECQKCLNGCQTCDNQYQCTSCYTYSVTGNNRLDDVSENCRCEDGYYDDGSNIACQPCDPLCSTCQGPTYEYCTKCVQGELFDTTTYGDFIIGTCKTQCADGSYASGGDCVSCHTSCETCNGPNSTDCLTCYDNGETLYNRKSTINSKGECACLDGYYDNSRDLACQTCSKDCLTCTEKEDNCSSCSGKNKSLPTCECRIYYELNKNGDCQYVGNEQSSRFLQFSFKILVLMLVLYLI